MFLYSIVHRITKMTKYFGSILGIFLIIQIISGFILSIHYCPNIDIAFWPITNIMKDINSGWLFHINGASFYFSVIYIHIGRNIFYCSYKLNRVWGIGIIILLISIAAAFIGYVLPWGQISYWGATVITNLLSAIPWYLLVKVYGRLKEFFVRMCFYTWKKKFTRRCIIADSVISYIIYYVLLYIIACACDV